jgi:hypothetical protein
MHRNPAKEDFAMNKMLLQKGLAISALACVILIALFMVSGIIDDRQKYRDAAVRSIEGATPVAAEPEPSAAASFKRRGTSHISQKTRDMGHPLFHGYEQPGMNMRIICLSQE